VIKVTWKQINDPSFTQAIIRLSNNRDLDNVTAYKIGRIRDTAIREMKKAADTERALRAQHGVAEGDPVPEEAVKELDAAFENTSVEIKITTLDFNQLKGLTAVELMAIEPICHNLPVEEEAG
jgi:hypothetical protein